MTTITLEDLEARQAELAEMIASFKHSGRTVAVPGAAIELRPGERYVGLVLAEDGTPLHHVILLAARPSQRLTWQGAMDWATSVGGYWTHWAPLPTWAKRKDEP